MDDILTYTLIGGESTSLYNSIVVFTLTETDHDGLNAVNGVATSVNNTCLNLFSGAILDMNENANVPSLSASGFMKDARNPVLKTFDMEVIDAII